MLILTTVLIAIGITNCYAENCLVGLLHDDDDWMKKVAFLAETEKLDFEGLVKSIPSGHAYDTLSTTCHMLSEGTIAIFGPQSEENSQIVESVCHTKDIPHIEIRWDDNYEKLAHTINLYPDGPTLGRAFSDLVNARQWKTFTIFYEDNESLARITEVLKAEREFAISIKQLDVNNSGDYRPILKEASKAGHTHFVLDCRIEHLSNILQQAQQVGLMTDQHHYIITNLDMQTIDLEPYKHSDTNITGFRMIDPDAESTKELAKIINMEHSGSEIEQSNVRLITEKEIRLETALIVDGINLLKTALDLADIHECPTSTVCSEDSSWGQGATAINNMRLSSWHGITGLVKLDPKGYRKEFTLDVVELDNKLLKKVAVWNSTHGITFTDSTEEGDLKNITFRVITTLTVPYGMLKESRDSLEGNDQYEGFAIDLIHELSLIEKFNYTFRIREDKSNGSKNKTTGKWDGMIGNLIDNEADLAITDLTITSEREEAVDFTTPFMNLGISILYQKPQKAPPNFFSFAEPFAFEVWKWLAGAYFMVSISLFIMGRLCPSEWTNPYPCVEEPEFLINQFSLRNSFWFTIGSLMQQGTEIAPIAYATRMTAGIWWFFTLIMVSSYTANLAAFLATENADIAFNDVYELYAKSNTTDIKFGAKANGATFNFFRDSNISDFHDIFNYMDSHETEVMVKENQHGVERAMTQHYAFFMESVSIEYEIQRHCNLTQVGGLLDEKGYGIAMRKDYPYRHKLNTALLKLQENGKIAELKRKWWEERKGGGQCSDIESQEAKPLTLKNVGGVFWVTVGGISLAIILVFVEMILHVMKDSIKHKAPFFAELKEELKFYMKFKGLVKPVRLKKSDSKSASGSEKTDQTEPLEHLPQTESTAYGFLPHIIDPTL